MVFVHPDDIAALGLADGDLVDLVSEWADGVGAAGAASFRVVAYDQPRGCAAAYYPETNPLVPLDSTAEGSNCPTSKSVIVRLEPPRGGPTASADGQRRRPRARPATSEAHRRAGPPVREPHDS